VSHHRFPICPISGKVRYRDHRDIKLVLRQADRDRGAARLNEVACSRRETRGYQCASCDGWHLTSQPARTVHLVPVPKPTGHVPGPAAMAIRRMVAATGLTVGSAAA
jgi:hypothetical protein